MTEYEKNLPVDDIILPPLQVKMPLGRIISQKNWRQLRAAESEKERFVTYYFNGQREKPFPGEERLIVPSPKIYTYDQQPEMSAHQLTEAVIQKLTTNQYRLTVVNFANADMVGHTGNLQASIKAVETIDHCIGKLVKFALSRQGICIITADHGNAESMINPRTGEPDTEHSSNHVPFIYIANQINRLRNNLGSGILADIAPTLLSIAGIPKPSSMTGKNLLG
jgi:2,3-bisphosphoglycerate-independent phosphoglycerate mutase